MHIGHFSGENVYINFILLSIAGIPSTIASMFILNKVGRKLVTLSSFSLASITSFIIAVLPNSGTYVVARLVLGIFGKFCAMAEMTCLFTWCPEIYPTSMRAVSVGVFQASARVGSVLSPLVVNELVRYGEWIPFVVIGVVAFVAAGFGLVLPETKGRKLKEDEQNDHHSI